MNEQAIYGKAKHIKLIAVDIDGVLTRGEIIFDGTGTEIKIWNVRDGLAFTIVKRIGGIQLAWITGRGSNDVRARAESLGIDYLVTDCMQKKAALHDIVKQAGVALHEVAYIGDDIIDISSLRAVGLGVCPKDAAYEVKEASHHVARVRGGEGVFRYVVELVLKAQGRWDDAVRMFE